jgi:hypothetical protein
LVEILFPRNTAINKIPTIELKNKNVSATCNKTRITV